MGSLLRRDASLDHEHSINVTNDLTAVNEQKIKKWYQKCFYSLILLGVIRYIMCVI